MTFPFAFFPRAANGGIDSYTKLLLHLNGTNGATTFPDASASAHTFSAAGNAKISTAQSKFGGSSLLTDGSGDWLNGDGSADFAFGTGDFTVDFWVYLNAVAANLFMYDSRPASTNGIYPTIGLNGSSKWTFYTNSGYQINDTGSAPSTSTWYHVALSRAGTSTRLFIGGTQVGSTYSDSNNYLNGASRPRIGADGFDGTIGPVNGYIQEVRVSKGIARWTANFTPPTSPYS